jgi:hypothetical protein
MKLVYAVLLPLISLGATYLHIVGVQFQCLGGVRDSKPESFEFDLSLESNGNITVSHVDLSRCTRLLKNVPP